jgi:phosphatidate cytidylyltransferase
MTGLLAITLPAFFIGGGLMALGSRTVARATAHARWIKFAVFFLIVHTVLGAAALGTAWLTALVALIVVLASVEFARALRRMPGRPVAPWIAFLLVSAAAMLNAAALAPAWVAFLFLVAATFDGFSQVVGQWIGRTPLAPAISPAKTVEGALGGLVAAVSIALAVGLALHLGNTAAIGWGVATAIAALAGDLSKSWIKRRAGIKDFGSALPGQGGFLDRFDSFLAACAIVGTALRL